jgi:serine/threonine protein kinase
MDFGLARQTQREQNVRITQSGMLLGTPAYMSPEQVDGDPDKVGPASDQFSLGVILYELLTGQLPFRGSLTAVMAQILTKETAPPTQLRPDLDPRIEAACLKMLAKDPAARFASLAAAAAALAEILRTPKSKAKPADAGLTLNPDAPAVAHFTVERRTRTRRRAQVAGSKDAHGQRSRGARRIGPQVHGPPRLRPGRPDRRAGPRRAAH